MSERFWIDIETLAGLKCGGGPITTATAWEYSPALSKAGQFSFTMPAGDAKAAELKPRRVARCYTIVNGAVTEVGAGIIDQVELDVSSGPAMLKVSGADMLRELTFRSTVGLALMEYGYVAPEKVSAMLLDYGVYTETVWTSFPQTITLGPDPDFLYIGMAAEFDTIKLTLTGVNDNTSTLRIQYYNGQGWVYATFEDGTAVGGAPLAQTGVITLSRMDGWDGETYGEFTVRIYAEDNLDPVTISDIEIGRWLPVDDALSRIIAYAPAGWTYSGDYYDATATEVYLPQPGRNVLECLTSVARVTGENFRLGTGRTIEWLQKDTPDNGVTAFGPVDPVKLAADDERCLLVSLKRTQDTYNMGSRVLPRGGGETKLTLAYTTRTPPDGYVLDTAANYIKRTDAETYLGGIVEMPIEDLRQYPVTGSTLQAQKAANQLFDWALEYLKAHSATSDADVPAAYEAEVVRLIVALRPGDVVHVTYHEWRDGYHAVNVDADLIVLGPKIRIDASGLRTVGLTVATLAQWPTENDAYTADLILQALTDQSGGGAAAPAGGTFAPAEVQEGPGIDIAAIEGVPFVGLGGDTILLYDSGGSPVAEFAATSAGLDAALAAATSGDVVWLPAGTIDGDHTVPAGIRLVGLGEVSSLTGTITNNGTLAQVKIGSVLVLHQYQSGPPLVFDPGNRRYGHGDREGPRVGIGTFVDDSGDDAPLMEAVDTENVPVFSAGFVDNGSPDDAWVNVGREGYPRIHFETLEPHDRRVPIVDAELVDGLLSNATVDTEHLVLPIVDSLDGLSFVEGVLFILRIDPDTAALYQWTRWGPEPVGGYHHSGPHTHESFIEGDQLRMAAAMSDVAIADPADGDLLIWDAETSKWVNAPNAAGSLALDDLTDVNAPDPDHDDVLTWDDGAGEWIPKPVALSRSEQALVLNFGERYP